MARLRSTYLILVFGFLYFPMALLIFHSFNSSKYGIHWGGFSWDWYINLATDKALIEAATHSLLVAGLTASFSCVIGCFGAIALERSSLKEANLVLGLLGITLMSPDIVMAVSLLILFIFLHIRLGFLALLLAHITFSLPYVTVTVSTRLKDFDQHIVEAAVDLGATEAQAIFKIVLPLLAPAILAGWLLGFTLSLDDVVVSFFVTGPEFEVLPLRIYSMVRMGVKPEVNALATILFGLSLILVGSSQWLLRGKLR